jgi:DNA-binding CsgD family transcriptional regulator
VINQDHRRLHTFINDLPRINTPEKLAEATIAVSGPLGLPTVMAGVLSTHGNSDQSSFSFGNWPPTWFDFYSKKMRGSDPIVHEARLRMRPFTWQQLLTEGRAAELLPDILALAETFGWRDGVAVPIHGPSGYVALVSFAGQPPELGAQQLSILRTLAYEAHDRATEIAANLRKYPPSLTKREIQVMAWVARGRTDDEIARILKISTNTAHTYIKQAMRKLGVRSRAHAVNEVLLHGLLEQNGPAIRRPTT